MQAIFRTPIRVDNHTTLTVAEMLNSYGDDNRAALERHGVTLTYGRRGPRQASGDGGSEYEHLFIDHRNVSTGLLKGTEWDGQAISTILKRIPGATIKRCRCGGRQPWGVKIPMTQIRAKYLDDGVVIPPSGDF